MTMRGPFGPHGTTGFVGVGVVGCGMAQPA